MKIAVTIFVLSIAFFQSRAFAAVDELDCRNLTISNLIVNNALGPAAEIEIRYKFQGKYAMIARAFGSDREKQIAPVKNAISILQLMSGTVDADGLVAYIATVSGVKLCVDCRVDGFPPPSRCE